MLIQETPLKHQELAQVGSPSDDSYLIAPRKSYLIPDNIVNLIESFISFQEELIQRENNPYSSWGRNSRFEIKDFMSGNECDTHLSKSSFFLYFIFSSRFIMDSMEFEFYGDMSRTPWLKMLSFVLNVFFFFCNIFIYAIYSYVFNAQTNY